MQPNPSGETPSPLFPSVRFFMSPAVTVCCDDRGTNRQAVARSCLLIAYFSGHARNRWNACGERIIFRSDATHHLHEKDHPESHSQTNPCSPIASETGWQDCLTHRQ